jgi:hypothetical protein
MWAILIASFLMLLALAAAAIVLNRRAFHAAGGDLSSRMRGLVWWVSAGLLLGLAIVLATMLRSLSVSSLAGSSFVVLFTAGAMAGLILGATAARRASTPSTGRVQQRLARISLVVAPLLLLAAFLATAGAAQFILSFWLIYVF